METIINNMYTVTDKKDKTDSAGRKIEVEKDIWPTGNNKGSFYGKDVIK
jgi:hypothetical protein